MRPTLLIANRGEIAARIARTARSLGIRTVAVFSEADRASPHVDAADLAVCIGPAPVGESYLQVEGLLEAAARTGATLVHPGYGFLSENAGFAEAVEEAGLVWVGPRSSAIAAMGDKAVAKMRMRAAGVPVVPGFEADDPSETELVAAAASVGFPLLVKATAGGGGRGMRRVNTLDELTGAIRSARNEASAAFGSGRVLLERYVEHARHVEIQILADTHGNVVHLGERDCSVQRRHQKVIEEAPSPAVDAALRQRMGQAACAAASAVGYVGAGTVELLLDARDDRSFYFLEMNTRLQVEHPVTELVTGLDLVELQLRVALGEPLPITQSDVSLTGHAIEARIYAEEPAAEYAPRTGMIRAWSVPADAGVRVDGGVRAGSSISAHYDPMMAKIVVYGPTREVARRRLAATLERSVMLGLPTNRRFLGRVLEHTAFAQGRATTRLLDECPELTKEAPVGSESVLVAAALRAKAFGSWTGFRNAHPAAQRVVLDVDGERQEVELGETSRVQVVSESSPQAGLRHHRIELDGVIRSVWSVHDGDALWLQHGCDEILVKTWDPSPEASGLAAADGVIRAPSAGRVVGCPAEVGAAVGRGDLLVLVEAMKIETRLVADIDGVISEVRAVEGQTVSAGDVVVRIQPVEEGEL